MTNKAIPKNQHKPAHANKTLLITVFVAYAAFVVLGLYDGLLGVAWLSMRMTFGVPIDALVSFAGRHSRARDGQLRQRQHRHYPPWHLPLRCSSSCVLMVAGLLTETVAPEWAVLVAAGGFVAGLGRV